VCVCVCVCACALLTDLDAFWLSSTIMFNCIGQPKAWTKSTLELNLRDSSGLWSIFRYQTLLICTDVQRDYDELGTSGLYVGCVSTLFAEHSSLSLTHTHPHFLSTCLSPESAACNSVIYIVCRLFRYHVSSKHSKCASWIHIVAHFLKIKWWRGGNRI